MKISFLRMSSPFEMGFPDLYLPANAIPALISNKSKISKEPSILIYVFKGVWLKDLILSVSFLNEFVIG